MAEENAKVRVAVTQAEPCWLDLDASVRKTCDVVAEAAANGAELVAFPECWIPGYPAWIWSRTIDFALTPLYAKNALSLPSPQLDTLTTCARTNNITVVLGFTENHHSSLYIAQMIISSAGKVVMHRRKMKPTHMERTVFGDASANCLDNVADTPVGRVGALACWEHAQPLLKYSTCLKREAIHVAAWPPVVPHDGGPGLWSMSREGCRNLSQTYAIESQAFVLHATAVLSAAGIARMQTAAGAIMNAPGGGSSAVFGPDGRKLTQDIPETEEGIVYADLDMDAVLRAKGFLDVCGHYSRPDLLWLGVDATEKEHLVVRERGL
ncbi:carbon-nitrogen hydrolase [Saccharata proteae CBS 121410]|uniref:nitrilase n=1 Tax=Saccharata proteae CBS 121410 TaxID=1314787 RepID=A0A9P4LXK7_9PEZI|nr:carbon-nitrogen hydrolase [Saccharata proteae CBS 121410]